MAHADSAGVRRRYGAGTPRVGSDANAPHEANFDAEDAGVVEALLDRDFPDRDTKVLVVDETTRVTREGAGGIAADLLQQLRDRNKTELFLGALPLTRHVDRTRRAQFWKSDLGPACGAIQLSLPGYSADLRRAVVEYWLARRNAADANADGWDIAILDRADDGWKVTTDEFHANPSVANAVNSDVPLRVGEM